MNVIVCIMVLHSRELLREKTFTNIAVWEPPVKVFFMKFWILQFESHLWKFLHEILGTPHPQIDMIFGLALYESFSMKSHLSPIHEIFSLNSFPLQGNYGMLLVFSVDIEKAEHRTNEHTSNCCT